MGVIYKVKPEVVQFIVDRKKQEPSIGCRRLADLVKESFGLVISKSSVSDVLHEMQLSSPVGRRAVYKPPKNFSIPEIKKKILRHNITPYLETMVQDGPLSDPQSAPVVSLQNKTEDHPEKEQPAEKTFDEEKNMQELISDLPLIDIQSAAVGLLPDPLTDPLTREDKAKAKEHEDIAEIEVLWKNDQAQCVERLGLILLTSFLWDMQRKPVLGEILLKSVSRHADPQMACALEILLLCQEIFPQTSLKEDGRNMVWEYFGLPSEQAREILPLVIESSSQKRTGIFLDSQIQSMSSFSTGIRLITKRNNIIYFDPLLKSFSTRPLEGFAPAPLLRVIETAADLLVNSAHPLVLSKFDEDLQCREMIALLDIVEGLDPLACVEILGEMGDVVATFDEYFSAKKEIIIPRVLTEHDRARIELETIDRVLRYQDPYREVLGTFFEGTLTYSGWNRPVRVIICKQHPDRELRALLTTSTANPWSVIRQALLQDKNVFDGDHSFVGYHGHKQSINDEIDPQISQESAFIGRLAKMAVDRSKDILPAHEEEVFKAILDMNGRCYQTQHEMFFRFDISSDRLDRGFLTAMMGRINAMSLKDYQGRILHFSLSSAS